MPSPQPPENPDESAPVEPPDAQRPASYATTEGQLESAEHDPYAALRFRDCRLFLLAWFVTVIGNQMQFTAVGWELYQRTHTKSSLGWAGLAQAIPVILLALPAGQMADLVSRRAIVVFCVCGMCACSVLLAVLSWHQSSVGWVYVVLAAGATFNAIGLPARSSLLAGTVPIEHFNNAATWYSSAMQTAMMLGPALGGIVLIFSVPATYLCDATSSLLCGLVLLMLRPTRVVAGRPAATFTTLMAGIRFVRETPIILATISLDLFAVLLGGAVYLLPVFATSILHVGAAGFGWLRSAPAIGAVVMGLTLAHLPPMKKAGRNLLLAVTGFGVATIVFGLSHHFWLSLAMLILTGALDNISVVVRHTLVQVLTPDEMRGRVSAVNNVFIGASNELGGWESGMTAQWFGTVWSVVGGGIGTILVVIAAALLWPEMRRFGSLKDAKPKLA